nr:hypothetical protein [Tanacetum cinerariifolium]
MPATSACINSRHLNTEVFESGSTRVQVDCLFRVIHPMKFEFLFDTLFLDSAGHSRSYIGISTFDQNHHHGANGQRGISQQRSPAMSSES